MEKLKEAGVRPDLLRHSAFIEEYFWMCTTPLSATLAMFADNDFEPHASATFTGLTFLAKRHQSITQFIAFHTWRWWRNRYGLRSGHAVFR